MKWIADEFRSILAAAEANARQFRARHQSNKLYRHWSKTALIVLSAIVACINVVAADGVEVGGAPLSRIAAIAAVIASAAAAYDGFRNFSGEMASSGELHNNYAHLLERYNFLWKAYVDEEEASFIDFQNAKAITRLLLADMERIKGTAHSERNKDGGRTDRDAAGSKSD
ncbi:hypothetical protein [Rubrimonas cliftonensis]|nr:hypothetical protein [Rubrimonas cliftonensis]